MAELGDRLGLEAKAGKVLGACLLPAANHLHRNQPVQTGLAGQVDHPHAPFAELFQELVTGGRGPVGIASGLVAFLGGRVVLTTPAHRPVGIPHLVIRGLLLGPERWHRLVKILVVSRRGTQVGRFVSARRCRVAGCSNGPGDKPFEEALAGLTPLDVSDDRRRWLGCQFVVQELLKLLEIPTGGLAHVPLASFRCAFRLVNHVAVVNNTRSVVTVLH
jgi:hypothetical protein